MVLAHVVGQSGERPTGQSVPTDGIVTRDDANAIHAVTEDAVAGQHLVDVGNGGTAAAQDVAQLGAEVIVKSATTPPIRT